MAILPEAEGFVPVPEGRIHYLIKGSGYPVVIYHAGGASTNSWLPIMEILGQHFTCYAFDLMGHGASDEPPRESFSIPDHARTMHQAMQALKVPRAHFIGNLAGASLCIETSASYPERVDKLVLVAVPVIDPRTTAKGGWGLALWDEKGLPMTWTPEHMKSGGHFFNPRPEWSDELNRSRAQGGKWTRIHSTTNAWYDMVARLPIIKPAATLVIMGEICRYNEIVDIMVFNLPNATKLILPKTGNFLHLEDTAGFTKAVLEFLK